MPTRHRRTWRSEAYTVVDVTAEYNAGGSTSASEDSVQNTTLEHPFIFDAFSAAMASSNRLTVYAKARIVLQLF